MSNTCSSILSCGQPQIKEWVNVKTFGDRQDLLDTKMLTIPSGQASQNERVDLLQNNLTGWGPNVIKNFTSVIYKCS